MEQSKKSLPVHWDEDGYSVTRTTAWSGPGCHEGCGVLLYVNKETGKLEKVEGDPEHPYNQGHLCPRCISLPQTIYHEQRLMYPMKRAKEDRGKDRWERISWDEAIDTIVAELSKVNETYGPGSVLAFRGTGRDALWHPDKVATLFDSPNTTGTLSGNSCYAPRAMVYAMQAGCFSVIDVAQFFADRYDHPRWKCPETIVVWGCNPTVSNPDNFFGDWIVQCMKRGAGLVVVDPRLTWIAAQAKVWLNLRPGTDTALAICMLKTMVDEGLYDKEFVEKWCMGFDEMKTAIDVYDYDFLAETTGVKLETIKKAARLYATSKPASIHLGVSIDMQRMGTVAAMTIADMVYISGNYDKPGGNVAMQDPYGIRYPGGGGWGQEDLTQEQRERLVGYHEKPLVKMGMFVTQPDDVAVQCITGEPYPIKGAWIQGTNTLACMGTDPETWMKVLNQMDFVGAADLWMTPTIMAHADVVLPVATFAERDGLRANWYNVSTINKAIEPVGECKSDAEIVRLIGEKARPDLMPYDSEQEIFDMFLQRHGRAPFDFAEAQERCWDYPDFEYERYEKGMLRPDGQLGFMTPSGKIELASSLMAMFGYRNVPYWEEPYKSPVSTPELFEEYPIVLMTGARSFYFHSEGRQIPLQRELMPEPLVYVNPTDAEKYGLKEGQWVWVENDKDHCKQKVSITVTVQPGQALASHGFWFPEGDPEDLFGFWDVNVSRLLELGHCGETGFGADIKCTLCKIYPMEDGE